MDFLGDSSGIIPVFSTLWFDSGYMSAPVYEASGRISHIYCSGGLREMTSCLSPYSALSLVRQRIHAVRQSTRLSGRISGLSRQCRKPCRFRMSSWTSAGMVETVQKLWSLRSWCCPSLSLLTAVSAAAMVSQMSWTTSNSGDGDLAASSFSVPCPGECCARFRAPKCSGFFLRTSYEVWLRMVQFLLFAVDGLCSRILLLGQGC